MDMRLSSTDFAVLLFHFEYKIKSDLDIRIDSLATHKYQNEL